MNARERREALAWCRAVASAAYHAANASGRDREYAELRDTIVQHERQHRRGSSFFGSTRVRGFTLANACDYFVCRTLADGMRLARGPVSALLGVREDYVRAAILASDVRFVEAFAAELKRREATTTLDTVRARIEAIDYCDFVGAP
jgi:hypothetical protein